MDFVLLLIVYILGLCVGSFLNVVISRTQLGESFYNGRSYCDFCKKQLSWFDNIPLLSFLALKGKSRCCKKKIDWTYPVVEFTTGILFVWWASLGFAFFKLTAYPLLFVQPAYWLLVGIILVIIFYTDLQYYIIPDTGLIFLGGLTFLYKIYLVVHGVMQLNDFLLSIASGIAGFLFFLILHLGTKGKGMGFGDVKFAFVIGLILGFPKALVGFFLSFIVGAIFGIAVLIMGKKKFGQIIPFGPFMVIGLVIALIWGNGIWGWYLGQLI